MSQFYLIWIVLFIFWGCIPPEDLRDLDHRESNGDELATEYEPADRRRSRRGSGGGSRRSSGGSSRLPTTDEVSRLDELEVEDYLDSVAYLYVLIGVCDNSSTSSTHKSCVLNCINGPSDALVSCLSTCNIDNSCSVSSVHGSGVFESSSTILTNHHVVEEAIGPYTKNGEYYYHIVTSVEAYSEDVTLLRSVRWHDEGDDIALVELNESLSGSDVPSFGSLSSLRLLDELFTIGNPAGVQWTASLGHLTNKNPSSDLCDNCILYSIPTGGGNSGGPVFNSEGRLVAIHAFVTLQNNASSYDNMRGGPHIDRIKELIQDNRSSNQRHITVLAKKERQLSRRDQREVARIVKDIVINRNSPFKSL